MRGSPIRVLFVCTGNICRSPSAEGAFALLVSERRLQDRVAVDSAGIIDCNVGHPPDSRAQRVARRRGIELASLRARQVRPSDFTAFDYVLAMDRGHLRELRALCPRELQDRIHLFLGFAPEVEVREVPDPYLGTVEDFESMMDLVDAGVRGLFEHIRNRDL